MTSSRVCVIDYGAGNTGSVVSAVEYLGVEAKVVGGIHDLDGFDKLILPGVGSFKQAMDNLHKRGLSDKIKSDVLDEKKPILGICLGFQMLFSSSTEEQFTDGLGLLQGRVTNLKTFIDSDIKTPHIGFNQIEVFSKHQLFNGIRNGTDFYFVHSYGLSIEENGLNSYSLTNYGGRFVSAVAEDHIMGTQFHPEKSQSNGLHLLSNFLEY